MYRIFKAKNLQDSFEEEGFVKVKLLKDNTISRLNELYSNYVSSKKNMKNTRYGMHISLSDKELEQKKMLVENIQNILKPDLDSYFIDYKLHLGGFLTKFPDEKSYTFPHQDWTFVDNNDKNAFSSTIWISLYNLKVSSGSLGFVKKSHRLFDEVIGSPSPATYTSAQKFSNLLLNYMYFPRVDKGDALIFNNKTIHGALPNSEEYPRVTIAVGITPANCRLYHYTLDPKQVNVFKKIKVDEDFFIKYMNDELYEKYNQGYGFEEYEKEKNIKVELTDINETELEKKLKLLGNRRNNFISDPNNNPSTKEKIKESQRSFFKTYTPINIYNEILYRLGIK